MDVLLIAGGWSPEREISLLGAKGIEKVLSERGHTVTFFNLSDGFEALIPLRKKRRSPLSIYTVLPEKTDSCKRFYPA